MKNIINDLIELANEGKKEMLICYTKDFKELTLSNIWDKSLIDEEYIVGTINLEVYNTYEDIVEEINQMLN